MKDGPEMALTRGPPSRTPGRDHPSQLGIYNSLTRVDGDEPVGNKADWEELLADVAHDVLDAGVVLEAVHGQVLAVAGVLEAAVRHLGDDRDVGVDPYRAEVQPLGHPHGAGVVRGPDAGGQAVLDAVGPVGG